MILILIHINKNLVKLRIRFVSFKIQEKNSSMLLLKNNIFGEKYISTGRFRTIVNDPKTNTLVLNFKFFFFRKIIYGKAQFIFLNINA